MWERATYFTIFDRALLLFCPENVSTRVEGTEGWGKCYVNVLSSGLGSGRK
jgi:hypothetical protein